MYFTLNTGGDFDEPHFKGRMWLRATLSDSAALEDHRKIQ